MHKLVIVITMLFFVSKADAQFSVNFQPDKEPTTAIQYFKPTGNLFVGDCIPFYHEGTYYLYWLLDSGHHSALGGLGGHQWTLSTSRDLKTWKHYPVVLGIDEAWEKSICTGSVVYYNKKFYAFYATRLIDASGKVNEQLSYAISDDGIHFKKQQPNPFYTSAPGYSKRNFRDPKVTVDAQGKFHLFVSSSTEKSLLRGNGALVHLTSTDLKNWAVESPLIFGQRDVPECPDYFEWHGWYYLIYGRGGNTFYLKSKQPYGPWEYPRYQALDEDWVNVAKTAQFNNDRRIVAGWIPSKKDSKDDGYEIFGGNIVLRELKQEKDGTLYTSFPTETMPVSGSLVPISAVMDSLVKKNAQDNFTIQSYGGQSAVILENIPVNSSISFDVEPEGNIEEYGVYLHASPGSSDGYKLAFSPDNLTASLAGSTIKAVDGLNKKITVQVIMKGDIIDVCINGKRCIVNRLYEQKGSSLALFAKHGKVTFSSIKIAPLQ
ncbi:family 43 glycosylhydrolase [Danxiaibacter flavus]|uniref:beta-fructofuranosidase n=1 Tax=Danxiaibacter flavus TaxID=3049108 RepID=A0ABV3Z7L3_9BACT|nr:family 43 glycosylhydrolase [Chitinophagaceae bacterium DXS]